MILLLLLKILGILLLSLLGLVLFLLLLLLCVPIRYDIRARYSEEARARLQVHWLLRLFLAKLEWLKDHGLIRARLLWLTKYRKRLGDWGPAEEAAPAAEAEGAETAAPAAEAAAKEPKTVQGTGEMPAAEAEALETAPSQEAGAAEAVETEASGAEADETTASETETAYSGQTEDSLYESLEAERADSGTEKEAEGAAEKLRRLEEKLHTLEDFLYDDKNIRTLELLSKQVKRLGKHLLPTKLILEGELGFSDPGLTGRTVGMIYSLYALNGEHIRVNGVYDRETISGYLEIKGRLRLGIFLEAAVRLFINKNFRRWLKYLRHRNDPSGTTTAADSQTEGPKEEQNGKQ